MEPVTADEVERAKYRGHPVQLPTFEGPLDLLLHLIKKDEVEIWEIEVSRITRQYLEYVGSWQALNIEIAGDFLVMAATLMRMKSQMLLPRPSFLTDDEEGEEPLTREALIARLIEYRKFREAAERFRALEARQSRSHVRGMPVQLDPDYQLPLREPRLVDLVEYFEQILNRRPPVTHHQVQLEEFHLDDQMQWVRSCLRVGDGLEPIPDSDAEGVRFSDCLRRAGASMEVVVTLLAILELAKLGQLRTWQVGIFSEIWLIPWFEPPAAIVATEAIGA